MFNYFYLYFKTNPAELFLPPFTAGCKNSKEPLFSWKKITTHKKVIDLTKHNVGILAGKINDIIVLDIDDKDNGIDEFKNINIYIYIYIYFIMSYQQKYLKYKEKYLNLKKKLNQKGGADFYYDLNGKNVYFHSDEERLEDNIYNKFEILIMI